MRRFNWFWSTTICRASRAEPSPAFEGADRCRHRHGDSSGKRDDRVLGDWKRPRTTTWSNRSNQTNSPPGSRRFLRRTHPQLRHDRESEREQPSTALRLGEWAVDLAQTPRRLPNRSTKTLTAAEFALLEILAETPNTPWSRAHILDRMGADSDRFVDRNVDVLVLRLRRKIEQKPRPAMPYPNATRKGLCLAYPRCRISVLINRAFFSSIAFRLPFAIAFHLRLGSPSVDRRHLACRGRAAKCRLQRAGLLKSRQGLTRLKAGFRLVSSAPFLMNATSLTVSRVKPRRVAQVGTLLKTMAPDKRALPMQGTGAHRIIELLESIEVKTLALAANADAAQDTRRSGRRTRRDRNRSRHSGSGSTATSERHRTISLHVGQSLQLGELQRRFVAETTVRMWCQALI